jgi:hypothetical protein
MPLAGKRTAPYVRVNTQHGRRAGAGEPLAFIRAHVDHAGEGCLIWPFGRYANGYCAIVYEGVQTFAHRVMCRLAHGEPAFENLEASHTCDRGHEGCLNPRHLVWETHTENHSRRIGRACPRLKGHRSGSPTKLDDDKVRAIRADQRRYREIAAEYGVSLSTIKHIRAGLRWKGAL